MLLLNGCDTSFTTFLDHLSAVALTVPRTIAAACRRCSCIFPQLVGFKKNAKDQFLKIPHDVGFYQRRPGDAPLQGVTKHQTPLEMAYCTLHADNHSPYYHLSCQGTANLVLEACTHVWNGESLVPLTERLRKMATDVYQRHSVTGYCLALSYRPLGCTLNDSLKGYFFEVPFYHGRRKRETLTRTHSFDSSQSDPLFDQPFPKSADELIEQWFTGHVLCGMVVSQYEVVPQAVQLIDHLENLCVRFVYFSRENELRSRVFAEKLGLEAGWNCHVSLAEITDGTDKRTLKDFFRSKLLRPAKYGSTSSEMVLNGKSRSDHQLYLKSSVSHPRNSPLSKRLSQITKVAALPNKARLPTGIAAVRPHLEQVDNVPLLVGLITDCTPEASLQMLEIMQEYGELVLAIGSSLSIVNTAIFLRADISISVLPLGDWMCSQNPAPSWHKAKEIVHSLMGVASDFRLQFEQLLELPKLVIACRHRLASFRGSLTFHFLASCMVSLSLLTSVVTFLPLLFDFDQIFLTVFLQLPCLTLGTVFTPFYPKSNIIRIASKLVKTSSLTCSFSDVVCAVASNISNRPESEIAIRHIVGLHQTVYLCALSSAWVYPLSLLWKDNPFSCPQYVISCVVSLVIQVFFFLCVWCTTSQHATFVLLHYPFLMDNLHSGNERTNQTQLHSFIYTRAAPH
ncbi:hypothetical protein KIN20_030688 [Parelaphostrongylus tenuis]|uniref:Uncharacterized protein n=1 Tax=Parelaphostrongylus tenuis TaxID=148309 RepID=A0AAD5R469_PARTN|nr:hypothetical protein KIN20_030688 [Parelaphostrongylus tenuis]